MYSAVGSGPVCGELMGRLFDGKIGKTRRRARRERREKEEERGRERERGREEERVLRGALCNNSRSGKLYVGKYVVCRYMYVGWIGK